MGRLGDGGGVMKWYGPVNYSCLGFAIRMEKILDKQLRNKALLAMGSKEGTFGILTNTSSNIFKTYFVRKIQSK